jgi:hypothetical protein
MLNPGDKLFVSHRRLFADDEPRFFAGRVVAYEHGLAKVAGHAFVRERIRGEFARKSDERVKLVPLGSGAVIVYQLPAEVDLAALRLESRQHSFLLTDGSFTMNLTDRVLQADVPARK